MNSSTFNDIIQMVLIYIFLVLSLGLHEAAHAKVAKHFGDTTPADDGVDTWNPLPHIRRALFSCVIIPALTWFIGGFFLGGAFVHLDPEKMKPRRRGYAVSVAAGPLANLAIAIVAGGIALVIALLTGKAASPGVVTMLTVGSFNFFIFVFNLLPIPPLDGSAIIRALFPKTERFFRVLQSLPLLLIFIITLQFGAFGSILFFPVHLYTNVFSEIIVALVP